MYSLWPLPFSSRVQTYSRGSLMIHSLKECVLWTIWEHNANWRQVDGWGGRHESLMSVRPAHLKGNGKYFMPCSAGLQASGPISQTSLISSQVPTLTCAVLWSSKLSPTFSATEYWIITGRLHFIPFLDLICSQMLIQQSSKWTEHSRQLKSHSWWNRLRSKQIYSECSWKSVFCTPLGNGSWENIYSMSVVLPPYWARPGQGKQFIPACARNLKYFRGAATHVAGTWMAELQK